MNSVNRYLYFEGRIGISSSDECQKMAPYLSHDGRRLGRLERFELFERLLAGLTVVDCAAERRTEGVLNDGVF